MAGDDIDWSDASESQVADKSKESQISEKGEVDTLSELVDY